jgi:putative addiction module component (TIGR02574 family)
MLPHFDASRVGAPSELEKALEAAKSLDANDRLRLIARLWASLPADHWAAPTPFELHEFERRLRAHNEGRLSEAPWEFLRTITELSPTRPRSASKLYSAPRRFDLFTIMIVTAAYAVLLSLMSALRFPPVVSCYVAAFITLVAIGQALLFGQTMPRLASVYAGMIAYFLGTISYAFVEPRFDLFDAILSGIVFSLIFGSVLGYLAGVLVGGVFLVADVLRKRYGRQDDESEYSVQLPSEAEPRATPHPLDDAGASPR